METGTTENNRAGRKLLFIVNPKAGKRNSGNLLENVHSEFSGGWNYEIVVWEDPAHFEKIRTGLTAGGYTDVIAVGGDGTVNQVASSLVGTSMNLGVLPAGSGNGLARSLGLSMDVVTVLRQIKEGKTAVVDHGTVNGRPFFCTAGVGFDAHIGNLFASSIKRGLKSYIRITIREIIGYRAKNYTLKINDQVITRKAFLVTVANAGQYGNDFYIAPQASMQDGLFHIALVKPFGVLSSIGLLRKVLSKKAHLHRAVETFVTSKLVIEREFEDTIHFDGEPSVEGKTVVFEMKPASLTAIVGDRFEKSVV